jgi:hypothetical protein
VSLICRYSSMDTTCLKIRLTEQPGGAVAEMACPLGIGYITGCWTICDERRQQSVGPSSLGRIPCR